MTNIYNKLFKLLNNVTVRNAPRNVFSTDSIVPIKMSYNEYDYSNGNDSSSLNKSLVIMHGLFGSKGNWQSLSKSLSKHTKRKVYTVDARNHGNSPHTEEFSYSHLSKDIKLFIDDINLKNVCLMGHSMGGRAAMMFSLTYPQFLQKLIVVDISPFPGGTDMSVMKSYFYAMKSVNVDPNLSSSEGRKIANEQLLKSIPNLSVRQFLLTNFMKSNNNFQWRFNLDVLEKSFNKDIFNFPLPSGIFDKPVLFLGGLKSDYLTPDHESRILKVFPQARFQYIDSGHWIHVEKPAEFISVVKEFICSDF